MEAITFSDFSGGITDGYLSCPPNSYAKLHNVWLDDNGKPYTRFGMEVWPYRLPVDADAQQITGLHFDSGDSLEPLVVIKDSVYVINPTSYTEIFGPTGNPALPNKLEGALETSLAWQDQWIMTTGYGGINGISSNYPHRIYMPTWNTYRSLTLGLPAIPQFGVTVVSSGGTGNNYIYAFHWSYTFTDKNGTTYEEKGPVTQIPLTNLGEPSVNQVNISAIPVLVNGTSLNRDTANLKFKIYRTVNNGSAFYYIGEVTNGTLVFTDNVDDTIAQDSSVIYTDGDAVNWTPPDHQIMFATEVNGFFWYASATKLWHSIQNAPGAVPAEFEYITSQRILGLNKYLSFPILFCDRSIYRVEGTFDEFGDGGYELREIDETAGCMSSRSIVKIPGGLVWAGNGGFYFTDGQQVKKISLDLDQSYSLWKNSAMVGVYDSIRNLVIWTVSSSANSFLSNNNGFVALHLKFGLQPHSVFTTFDAKNNIRPNCLAFRESSEIPIDTTWLSRVLVGDARGYILLFDEKNYTDPFIIPTVEPTAFAERAIAYRIESSGLDLGADSIRKYVTNLTAEFNASTELAIQPFSRRNDGGPWAALSEIRVDGSIIWDITEYPWDGPLDTVLHDWDSDPIVEGARHFPAATLRSTRRQVALSPSKTWLAKSGVNSRATVLSTSRRVILEDFAPYTGAFWPEDCEDYEILFATDTYVNSFVIKERLSDVMIEVFDPYYMLPVGATAVEWQMRGYRKFERMNLLSFTVHFEQEGMTQAPNRGVTSYTNA